VAPQILERIRDCIRTRRYDLTSHAFDAIAEDELSWLDLLPFMSSMAMEKIMYNYPFEYCDGTVRPKRVVREAFKHREGFVIMNDITIGVCDKCGNRYYHAEILRRVEAIATGQIVAAAEECVPVGHFE